MKRIIVIAITLLLALSAQAQNPLVARWAFDEGKGTNIVDSSGQGFNGFLEGSPLPIWTNGVNGSALAFDGVQNQVTIPTDPVNSTNTLSGGAGKSLVFPNGLTVSAWVKAKPGSNGEIIANWSTNGVAAGSFMLSLTNGVPCFELRLNGVYRSLLGVGVQTDAQWHFVAGTYDGSQMSVYWDSMVRGNCVATGTVDTVDAPVQIGLLDGLVDEVRLYSQPLSAMELKAVVDEDRAESGLSNNPLPTTDGNSQTGTGGMAVVTEPVTTLSGTGSEQGLQNLRPKIWYVNGQLGDNANEGRHHGRPKKEIRAAMQAAGDGDTIQISEGVYRESLLRSGGKTVILRPTGTVVVR